MSDPPPRPEPCVPQLLEAERVAIKVLAEDGGGCAEVVHHGVDEETARWVEPSGVYGEVFGNLCLGGKRGGGPFTERDPTLVRVPAAEAGIALGSARLYVAARQRERWIDGPVAVTTALLSGGDIGASLRTVAEQARRLSGAAAGIVLLPAAEGGLETVAVDAERPFDALGVIVRR